MTIGDLLKTWRLITDDSQVGAWNMAVDEALLGSVADGASGPVLRLYRWSPACLSLGRAQSIDDIDMPRLAERGWDIVRRPTGGRAILHQNELTYAVIAAEDHPLMRGGVLESYRRISSCLVRGLEHLAIQATVQVPDPVPDGARKNPICFEVPSAYEISVAGLKIIGSAQVRKRKTVLQHGSLPLAGDLGRICDVLSYPDESSRLTAKETLLQRAATLEQVLGKRVAWELAAHAMILGFEEGLKVVLTPSRLSEAEQKQARTLLESRYQDLSWTTRHPAREVE